MIEILIAGLLAATPYQPQSQQALVREEPTRLEDIEVTGRRLDTMIQDFVSNVAAPVYRRNFARWNQGVCVGAANLGSETGQYVVDRVSTVAQDLGLRPGAPGCTANIMVIATSDPSSLAETLVARSPKSFRPGGPGMEHGGAKLRAFQASDRPVRWWPISVPMDSHTGQRAVRIPGDCQHPCSSVYDYSPQIYLTSSSRISTQIVDNLVRVIVIVDARKLDGISAQQLADYVAMVSLAQIEPEADTSSYASILNLFEDPAAADTLTTWDTAYLRGVYASQRNHRIPGANRAEVAASIRRAHHQLQDNQP